MTRPRFTREDWIDLGRERLARAGVEAIKLDAICKASGLTRGSFYHHFSDHEGFLIALSKTWLKTATKDIAARLDETAGAEDQMEALTDAAMTIDYRLELGIRELARRLPAVQAVVAEADALRLDVLTELYQSRFSLAPEAARDYAYLEYAAFSGLILLDRDMPAARQKALAAVYARAMSAALSVEGQP